MYNLILTTIFIFSFLPFSRQQSTLANNLVVFVPDIIPEYSVAHDIYVAKQELKKKQYNKKLQQAQGKAKKQFRPLRPIEPTPLQFQQVTPQIVQQTFANAIGENVESKSKQNHRSIQKQENKGEKLQNVEIEFEELEVLKLKSEKVYKVNDISEQSVISGGGDVVKPMLKENNPEHPEQQQDVKVQQRFKNNILEEQRNPKRIEPKPAIITPQQHIQPSNRQNNQQIVQKRQQNRQTAYKQLDFRQNREKNNQQIQVNFKKQTEQQQNIISSLQKAESDKKNENKFQNNPFTPKHVVIETMKQKPTNKNLRVDQQTEIAKAGMKYDKLLFTLLFALTAILILFSYTPEQQQITKRSYNPNPDDEQISLK